MLRAGLHHGVHQPDFRLVDGGLRLGTTDRSPVGPSHPPRPHPGDERRKLPPQEQQGNRRVPSSRRSLGRIGRTVNAVSSCSFNVSTLTDLLPSVIISVVHDSAAPVAQLLGAIETQSFFTFPDRLKLLGFCILDQASKLDDIGLNGAPLLLSGASNHTVQ